MEKQIGRWTYWAGVGCLVIAVLWRAATSLGVAIPRLPIVGKTVSFTTFVQGAVLFLLAAIATANYAWVQRQNP